jgi:pyruvate dehydrogenase E1 component alpha subunit/2-oxoisovalerate dehydrogenase E1 component alpha subunit
VVANNHYAYSTPSERQFACRSLVDKAAGYGVEGQIVDGTDLAACLKVVGDAAGKVRTRRAPQLVVAKLLRLCGHGEHDDASYIDPKLKASPVGRDCLKVAEKHLVEQGWAEPHHLSEWREETMEKVEQAVAKVQREPGPDPYKENWGALASKHLTDGYDQQSE